MDQYVSNQITQKLTHNGTTSDPELQKWRSVVWLVYTDMAMR